MLAIKETKFRAARILSLSPTERSMQGLPLTLKGIGELVGATPESIGKWKAQLPEILDEMRADENRRQVQERLEKDSKLRQIASNSLYHDASEVSEDEKLALARKVYNDAIGVGASTRDKELAVRMLGLLIEKQEVTHKLDGGFIAREILRARRELEAEGVVQVSDESSILSPDLRLSSGQEQS